MPQRKLAQVEKAEQNMDRRQNVGKIKERKEAKRKIEGARSERLKQRWREEYSVQDKEVKRFLGGIGGIGWRRGLQQQRRPLRMVETRSYTANPR